jgi:hypothetical protein
MTEHDYPRHPEPDDPLDQLLHSARWPEPADDSVRRLRNEWRTLRTAVRPTVGRRRWLQRLIAVAAMIAVAAYVGWWLQSRPDQPDRRIAPVESPRAPSNNNTVVTELVPPVDGGEAAEVNLTGSRPATAYEQLLIRMAERRRQPKRSPPPAASADPLDAVIEGLLADASADVSAAAASLSADRESNETRLLGRLTSAGVEEQRVIARLLALLGSPRSVPALLTLAQTPETHAAAIRALTLLADENTLAALARAEREPSLQTQLIGQLLSRNSREAVALYLDLFAAPQLRGAALVALDDHTSPPIELLFAALNNGDSSQRLSAAVLLGRIDGPQVTERLVAQVFRHINRQEAFVALLASSGQEARQFIDAAHRDQTLFAAVNSAQLQLQRLSQ